MAVTLQGLKERKIVQWALAYVAGAWLALEVIELLADVWEWPAAVAQGAMIVLALGLFVALTLAWYHGEKGRQRVSGPELLVLALLLVIASGILTLLNRGGPAAPVADPAASEDGGGEDIAARLNALPGIAILPFVNRSDDSRDQYFTDGVHDELLTRLSMVQGIRVIARTSVEGYRDGSTPIRDIGRDLHVGYVMEGGVQRVGDRVRVNVQLIDAGTEAHLWAEIFDRTLTPDSLFDIQSDIVAVVAGELGGAILEEEAERNLFRATDNLEVVDLMQRAAERFGQGRADEAATLVEQALDLEPDLVPGHALASFIEAHRHLFLGERGEDRAAAARAAAERAVARDPAAPIAQLAMGYYLYAVEKDYAGALEWYDRGSSSLWGSLDYHWWRGLVERRMGRWPEAVRSLEAAMALNPRDLNGWRQLALAYRSMRRWADVERVLGEVQRIAPDDPWVPRMRAMLAWNRDGSTAEQDDPSLRFPATTRWLMSMHDGRYGDAEALLSELPDSSYGQDGWTPRALREAWTYQALGREDEARERFLEAATLLEVRAAEHPEDWRYHGSLGLAWAGLGRRDDAVREARTGVDLMPLGRDAIDGTSSLLHLASVYAQLGDVEATVAALEELLAVPSYYPPAVLEDEFWFHPVRDDPRFRALMDRERDRVF